MHPTCPCEQLSPPTMHGNSSHQPKAGSEFTDLLIDSNLSQHIINIIECLSKRPSRYESCSEDYLKSMQALFYILYSRTRRLFQRSSKNRIEIHNMGTNLSSQPPYGRPTFIPQLIQIIALGSQRESGQINSISVVLSKLQNRPLTQGTNHLAATPNNARHSLRFHFIHYLGLFHRLPLKIMSTHKIILRHETFIM